LSSIWPIESKRTNTHHSKQNQIGILAAYLWVINSKTSRSRSAFEWKKPK